MGKWRLGELPRYIIPAISELHGQALSQCFPEDPNTGLTDSQNLVASTERILDSLSQVSHAAQRMLMRNGLKNLGEAGVGAGDDQ